ncbi:MAG: PQQ-binding-like beta-propeller repeat protein [Cyclobacteriaceae bacterium]|jgi:outer membrane protein assembly factor BamB|nr:PQQ-binding-like beta-propeller repeat protein [Cyclobacteriaceae bacterium]
MKKLFLIALAVCCTVLTYAQEEMTELYTKEIEHSFNSTGIDDQEGYIYASSGKEISVIKNATGDVLWTARYKDISEELGKVDDIMPMWDAKVLFLFDRKIGKDKIAAVDAMTGKLLWVSGKYQDVEDMDNVVYIPKLDAFAITTKKNLTMIKVRSGEELWATEKFKGIVGAWAFGSDGSMVMINMKATLIGSLFAGLKNQIVKINPKNGDILWDQTYRGVVERKILTKEKIVNMEVENNKVFLYMNGIQVFDYADGKPLWSAVWDASPSDVVKNKKPIGATMFGAYGVVAEPIVVGDYIYVIDMENKRNQYLKKYEIKTGKMVWRSAEIKDARAIPGIHVSGDKVILQVGGLVELQYVQKKLENGNWVFENHIEGENIKPLNVQCFNAITGEQLWESDKMKRGMTNLFLDNNNVIVCSGKALYSMDIATGKENYELALKEDNVGVASMILKYKDQVIVVGEKGVSSRKMSDGSLTGSSKFKSSQPLSMNGKYIYGDGTMALVTPGSDFGVYNLNTMTYKRFDARRGASAYLSIDGLSLYVLESGNMMRKSKLTKLSAK